MVKCTYCGSQIPMGRGITYVEISGKINTLCSSKCKKNRILGRDPLKLKWTEKSREESK